MSIKPLFSVVTVCYNSSNLIRKTIESVLAQKESEMPVSFDNAGIDSLFEYVIQDGASNDDTLSIVESYADAFAKKGINFTVNTGKDGGIYDAMNKAVQASNGKYVIFMNADDCFYSDHVLADVFHSLKFSYPEAFATSGESAVSDTSLLPDIIYGDCIVKELGMYFKFKKCFDLIKDRMPFSHQACFAKRELLLETPLNSEYRITADYDFLLKSYLSDKNFFDSNVTIALVTADGLSSVHMLDTFVEVNKVCDNLGCKRFDEEAYNKKLKEMKIKQFVLSYFPDFIKLFIRKNQIKKRGQITDVTLPPWCE